MSDIDQISAGDIEVPPDLHARAEGLEHRLADLQKELETRVITAELKVEAIRAGMIDLDGLKLIDRAPLRLNERGEVDGVSELMNNLKRTKPWMFGGASTSSSANAPSAQPPRQKRATEMTDEEYREARAALLRRQS